MVECSHLAPNGEKSLLYQQLEQKYGADKAHDAWEMVRSQQFLNKHGDWMNPGNKKVVADVNGEPLMNWVEKVLNLSTFNPANQEQKAAITSIRDFIEKGDPDQFFTLAGKAGTGKTTIIQEAIAPFIGKQIIVAALSHKAKLVLENKIKDRFGSRAVQAESIASMLGMGMDVETGKFSPEFGNSAPPIDDAQIIIVDESSMVNEEALALIMERKPADAKVIFLGDIGQLPPIRENAGANAEAPSPTFKTNNQAKLLERVRQGEESPILPYADKFWDNSQGKAAVANPAPDADRHSIVTPKGSLVFSKGAAAVTAVLPLFKEAIQSGNPDIVKIVVYRNATRTELNSRVRKYVFGEEQSKQQFVKGDLLMFQDNYKNNKTDISNSTEVQVGSAHQENTTDGWKIWSLGTAIGGAQMQLQVLDTEDKPRFEEHLNNLANEAKKMAKGFARTQLWKKFFSEKSRFAPVDYSYAITSHKAQGSTYDAVLVGEQDIMGVGPISNKAKSQSIYTAITRAKHMAIVMDGKTDDGKLDEGMQMLAKQRAGTAVQEQVPAPEVVKPMAPPSVVAQQEADRPKKEGSATENPPAPVEEAPNALRSDVKSEAKLESSVEKAPVSEPEVIKPVAGTTITRELGDKNSKKKVDESAIVTQIQGIYTEAITNPETTYHIPYEYLGERTKLDNKYTARELADLFDKAGDIPPNITFTPGFRTLLNNTAAAIVRSFPAGTVDLINRNEPAVMKAAGRMLIQKVDGTHYTAQQQKEVVDSLVKGVETLYRRDPAMKGNAVIKVFQLMDAQQKAMRAKGDPMADHYQAIYNNRMKLAESVLNQLRSLGLQVDATGTGRIMAAVSTLTPLTEQNKVEMDSAGPVVDDQATIDPETLFDEGSTMESTGRIVSDWSQNSFELDPRDTASARIKMFMATQREMDKASYVVRGTGTKIDLPVLQNLKDGTTVEKAMIKYQAEQPGEAYKFAKWLNRTPFWLDTTEKSEALKKWMSTAYTGFPKNNFMGLPKNTDFQETFQKTMNLLGNRKVGSSFDEFMSVLKDSGDPTIAAMADELNKQDQQIKNEFMTVMMKQYQQFLTSVFNIKQVNGQDVYVHQVFNTNRYNQRDALIKEWQQNQKLSEITIMSPSGERVLDTERIRARWIPILQRLQAVVDWTLPENRANFVNWMGQILNLSGIPITEEALGDLFDNPSKWTNNQSVAAFFGQEQNTGVPTGMFSIFIKKAAGMMRFDGAPEAEGNDQGMRMSQVHNPMYTETTTMHALAKLMSKYTQVMYSSNHLSGESKSVYDWGMNTKLSNDFREFTTNFQQVAERLKDVDIAKDNWLINHLKSNPDAIAKMELYYMDTIRPKWKSKGITRQSMSDREQMLASLMMFQNQGHAMNNRPITNYMSLTHSDKTTTPIFHNMPKINVGWEGLVPATVVGKMDSYMFNVFKSEHNRIVNQASVDSGVKRYEAGKNLFYFIPQFNYDGMTDLVSRGIITQQEMNYIYPAGERNITRIIDSTRELPVINKVLMNFLGELVSNTVRNWKSEGIVDDKSTMFDQLYYRRMMAANGIIEKTKEGRRIDDPDGSIFHLADGQILSREQVNDSVVHAAALDYALNHFLFNTSLSQIFYGDPAENFKKDKAGKTDMDYVNSTMKEYSKRLAKDIAPHSDLNWDPGKRTYNAITLRDVITNEAYLKDIQALAKAYNSNDIESTDAQELTTVQEHLDVLYAMGRIPSTTYNEMSTIISKAGTGYYEFTKPEHLAVIMQPMKPVYAGFRTPQNGARLTDYVKSSSYSLYPPFTQGREIDKLRVAMETHNIQRANYESARKLGSPITSVPVFDSEGRYLNPSATDIQKAMYPLDRSGFGIQQDNPYDENKEAIKILTQMNENLVEGITDMKGFILNGEEKTGAEMKDAKEDVKKRMVEYQRHKLLSEFDKTDEGLLDIGSILDRLVDKAQSDPTHQFTLNEIQGLRTRDSDGTAMIPPMFSPAADRIERLLQSMVNSIVDLKMPGKSYIQASSTGIRLSEGEDLNKTIRVGTWDGSPLKTMRPDPENPGKVLPGQIIIPFNFFDASGKKLDIKDFTTGNVIDPDKLPPELLQMIAGRVPNQSHSSMLAVEVVGFTPSNMGDIAFVPAAIVKQMGADFDVDKLYTYKRPYKYENGVLSGDISDRMPKMQKEYFDIHWGILNNPAMLEKILKPLDKSDLKDEATRLTPKSVGFSNYFDPMSQLEDFQRGKNAKRLVGSASWAVKFNARAQDKDLFYSREKMETTEEGKVIRKQVPDYVEVIDEHTGDLRLLGRLSGSGTSTYTKQDGALPGPDDIRTKNDNHIMVQSEAVDNAKNRTLDPLNLTPDTYKAVQAFIQLENSSGWAANSKYWTRLLTQPIIQDYAAEMKKGNDSLSQGYTPNLHNTIVEKMRVKYQKQITSTALNQVQQDKLDAIRFSPQLLLKAQAMKGEDFAIHQLAALELFRKLYDIGDRMFQVESYLNQDVGGAGPSLLNVMDRVDKVSRINQVPVSGAQSLLTSGGQTEVGKTFHAINDTATNLTGRVFPYMNLGPLFANMQSYIGKTQLSLDQQKALLKGMRSMAYSSNTGWWLSPQAERVRLFYGADSLAHRLAEAKKGWGADNPLLARLSTRIGDNSFSPDYVEYQAVSKALATDKESISAGWLNLLMSTDKAQRSLGEDLARYAMLTGGIQDANSFSEFLPTSWLAGTEMSGVLKDMELTLRDAQNGYQNQGLMVQVIQHNPEFVPGVTKEQFGKQADGREYPEAFHIPDMADPNFDKFSNLTNAITNDLHDFVSYYSRSESKWILFKKTFAGDGTWYARMDTLGNKNSDEYDASAAAGIRSIFPENRAMADRLPGIEDSGLEDLQNYKLNAFRLGNFNTRISHFNQIGVKEGGAVELHEAYRNIAEDDRLPQFLRTTAQFLDQTREAQEGKDAKSIINVANTPFKLSWTKGLDKTTGGVSLFNNEVQLNLQASTNIADAASIFLHEMTHNRLQFMIMATGYDPAVIKQLNNPAAVAMLQKSIETYRDKYPEVFAQIKELDRIRYEALSHLRTELGDRFEQVKQEVEADKLTTNDHLLYYGLSNVQELVAHVMSDQTVAEYLNRIESTKGRTLVSRIWDALTKMMYTLAKSLGVNVKSGSLLEEALTRTMKMMDIEGTRDIDITSALMGDNELRVPDENLAMQIQHMAAAVYGRNVEVKGDELGWTAKIGLAKVKGSRHSVEGQRGRVLDQLYKQLDEVSEVLNRPKQNIQEKVKLRARQREIRSQITNLHQTTDINTIAAIGDRQLQWVDEVLRSPQANTVDVNMAINTAHVWESLLDILYGDLKEVQDVNQKFTNLQTEAQKRRIELINRKAPKVLTEFFKGDVSLIPQDFKENLKDVSIIEANTMSPTRYKPQLIQATAAYTWREANNRDEHVVRNTKKLEALQAKMSNVGLTSEMMLQHDEENGWGLVNRLSPDWYEVVDSAKYKKEASIEAVDKAPGLTKEQRTERKKTIWTNYWNALKGEAHMVDIRHFLNVGDGKRLNTPASEAAMKKLVADVGSEGYAKELLTNAEEKYQNYLTEREAMKHYLQSSIELTDEQKEGKSAEEQEHDLSEIRESELRTWLQFNSPIELLGRLDAGTMHWNSEGERWLEMTPKDMDKYGDDKYQQIEKDPAKLEAFNEYKNVLEEMISYLPMEVQRKLPDNFLPIVPKDTASWLTNVLSKIRNWDTTLLKAVAATDWEEASRLRPDKIPVMYTQARGVTKDIQNRSTDVVRVLEMFSVMALQHRYMGNVLEMINITENIMKEANVRRISGQDPGKVLENIPKAIKYMKDAVVFMKPKELEGKVKTPLYTFNLAKQHHIEQEIKALIKQKDDLQKQSHEKWISGDYDTKEEDDKMIEIDDKLTKYEQEARNIYGSKFSDVVVSINQMKAMAWNPFSAVTNYAFAAISLHIYGQGNLDYTVKDAHEAFGVMSHAMKKYWMFNKEGDATAQKIHNLMARAGIVGDAVDSDFGKSNMPSRKSKFRKTVEPFQWQRSGDYFTKGQLMVAMLKARKVEVTEAGTGTKTTIPLWEAFNSKGEWDTDKYEPQEQWYAEDIHQQTEWNKYRDRMRKVSAMVYGNQDRNTPMMAKKTWLLRMAGQFRMSWFPEGIATRFKGEYHDINLDRNIKGRYRTIPDLGILNSGLVLAKQLVAALPGVKMDPFNGVTMKNGKPLNESAIDVENMRKNFAGLAWTVAFMASIVLIRALAGKQHKKDADDKKSQLLVNMLIRNYQDLMMYSSPSVFNTVSGNFLPATQVITDYWNAVLATGHYMFHDKAEKHAFKTWVKKITRAGLPHPVFTQYNKWETMLTRDIDKIQR